ncbi:MAG TPA: hypothetical protein VI968_00825 [archaeon]|nr:hypothetical protein [archaeon]
MRKESLILFALPLIALMLFAGIAYSESSSAQVTATVRVLSPYPHDTQLTIGNSAFIFYGSLKDKESGQDLGFKYVRLTLQYPQGGITKKVVLYTRTYSGGSWFIVAPYNWKTAKIEFLGDSQYRPSSATLKR